MEQQGQQQLKWWEYGMQPVSCAYEPNWLEVWEEIKQDPSYPADVDIGYVMYTYHQLCYNLPLDVLISHMLNKEYMFLSDTCPESIADRIHAEFPSRFNIKMSN
jgi:hypothetical protein